MAEKHKSEAVLDLARSLVIQLQKIIHSSKDNDGPY